MLTCSDQTVEPASGVIKVIHYQRIRTTEQVEKHKEVLERKMQVKTTTESLVHLLLNHCSGNVDEHIKCIPHQSVKLQFTSIYF